MCAINPAQHGIGFGPGAIIVFPPDDTAIFRAENRVAIAFGMVQRSTQSSPVIG